MKRPRRGGPAQYDERLARARELVDTPGVEHPMRVLAEVLAHQQRRTKDPTVVAASALLRAPAEPRAAAATYPLVDAADITDPVDGEVVVAIDALVPVSTLPPPLMTAARALADRGLRAAAVAQWLFDPALPDPVAFWISVAAQPVFELAAIGAPVPRREHWAAAACPVCGAAAQVSVIAEESGEFMAGSPRSLWCSRCAADWTYPRARCVRCGEDDARRVGSWVADVWPTVRIESCDTCRGYIKTFDLREAGGVDVVPLVDDVASAALDLWAAGRGLQRSTHSLAGV